MTDCIGDYMKPIKKVLVSKEKTLVVKDTSKDYHTQFGFIKKKDLKKKKGKVKTNTGKEFSILEPSFIDQYKRIKRGAQIIMRKDVGMIISETGVNKKSKVVDAGAGSGGLCLALANIVKEVVTYEIRKDFTKLVNENIEFLGLKNIKVKNKDVCKKIDEKNVDLVTLDVPEPWRALNSVSKALKPGGFLVSYSPCITQVMEFVKEIEKNKEFIYEKTIEILKREWIVEGRKVRPRSDMLGHTGFLSFVRKI